MHAAARRRASNLTTRLVCLLAFACLSLCGSAAAQSSKPTDGTTPLGLSPGAPAGSYALGGFDNVNLYSGSLNFRLPLLSIGGRGGAAHTILLPVEQHWQVDATTVQIDDYTETHFYPENDWWQSDGAAYSPGTMHVRYASLMTQRCVNSPATRARYTLTRLTFTAADGTEFELRDQLTGGQRSMISACATSGTNRGRVFVTADGTAATFVSDQDIYDAYYADGISGGWADMNVSGYLLLKDGTRYRVDGGYVSWIRDRNGNKLTFAYNDGYGVSTITDSLNRQVTISYNNADGGQYGTCDHIGFKGFGGASRIVRVCKTDLASALRSGYSLQTPAQLFPGLEGSSYSGFNTTVVSAVWLPDGDGVARKYQLRYNPYGELARVELPTGGAVEFDYDAGLSDAPIYGGVIDSGTGKAIYRRVVERREYADGVNLTNRMTYSRPESTSGTTLGYVVTDQKDANGALLARQRHYFSGGGGAGSILTTNPTAYPAWDEGREYETEVFDFNGTTVLRRVENTWQANGTMGGLPVNPVVSQTLTTLVDTNQVAKQTFAYDAYNNQTDVYDYDYGAGAPGAYLRRTHTDYLTTNPANGVNYATSTDVHIRNLPALVSVYDAAGTEQARTTFEYDNYAADTYHAALTARANISGLDAAYTTAYTTRGNATASSRWLLPAGTAISSYQQYDVAGNVVRAIDARGNAAQLYYADCFGAPNGEAHANTQPAELGTQSSYAFATSATNAAGQISYVQFDYYLGKPVDAEDVNGVVSSGYYNDVLDRPTQLVLAAGTGAKSQTTFVYNDAGRAVTTTSDLTNYNDNQLKSEVVYDQLGRTYESRQYESGSNYAATQRTYDALGRAYRMSNPFRPWQGQTPAWTTTQFDALGRTINVTTPDGAQVLTAYSGNQVTVTDQAGKSRRSATDALGRMAQVVEDPNGLAYATSYTYDVLGNLRKVDQGGQLRFFLYDSLSRLIRAKLPEQSAGAVASNMTDPLTGNAQWSAAYGYDAGGNLTARVDARDITTVYVYDALNRSTSVDYSDTPVNPDISRFYDNPAVGAYGKGRFWYSYAGGDYTNSATVEHTATDAYDAAGRPLTERQLFKTSGAWGATYQTTRAYNLAGGVTSEVYPSGHTVSYAYDAAGRLSTFAGNLGDGAQRTYATGAQYDEAGRMTQEQFGTAVPLYHRQKFNARGQLTDARLGTAAVSPAMEDWDRGALMFDYGTTDDNGNLHSQSNWIQTDAQHNYTQTQQNYSYDSLNRLSSMNETRMAAPASFQQVYTYDRWGNRQIDAGATTAGINKQQFTVDTATNRYTNAGMVYDAAGNLVADTYSAASAQRAYDAEGRMTTEQNSSTSIFSYYTYDASGQRTRRAVGAAETWQVYGIGGELVAEYAQNAPPSSPQKEYGYRGGELLVTAAAGAQTVAPVNLALGKSATQVSTLVYNPPGDAAHAVDGNTDGNYFAGSVTHTATGGQDWWQVDLGAAQSIASIDLWNRTDCCSERLSNFYVFVSDVPFTSTDPAATQAQAGVWSAYTPGQATTRTTLQVSRTGRYVRVQLGGAGILSLAEVQVWGLQNLSAGQAASQSSTLVYNPPGDASHAVDGNTDGNYFAASVTHTNAESQPWWQVDLGGVKAVGSVEVWNRTDCCAERLTDFYVLVSDAPFASTDLAATLQQSGVSAYRVAGQGGRPTQVAVGRTGRYVRVQLAGSGILSLAEVRAWGGAALAAGQGEVRWAVGDHLGTPRITVDQTGALSAVTRHDYLPFGEELPAGSWGRTTQQGYATDLVKQKFAGYERDAETSLNFAEARYHSDVQGRFTSVDPLSASAKLTDPQSFNRYSYVGNNPTTFSDPSGMIGLGRLTPQNAIVNGNDGNSRWVDDFSGVADWEGDAPERAADVAGASGTEVASTALHEIGDLNADSSNQNIAAAAPQSLDEIYRTPPCNVAGYNQLTQAQRSLISSDAYDKLSQLQRAVFVNITGALSNAGANFTGLKLSSVENDRLFFSPESTNDFRKSIEAGTKTNPATFNNVGWVAKQFGGHDGMDSYMVRQNVAANALQVGFGKKGAFADIDLWNPQKEFKKHQAEVKYNGDHKTITPHFYLAKIFGNCR